MPILIDVVGSGGASSSTCLPWATADDVCSPCDDYDLDQVQLELNLQAASDVLFELSGRQFAGECEETVRPCGRRCGAQGCCGRRPCRSCGQLSQIRLGGWPLRSIVEVIVDGEVLSSLRYRIDDDRWLVRLPDADGSNPGWPTCQRMELASTELDTFEVTYTYGQDPPSLGVAAAAELACELTLACQPETIGECRLPQRVQSITRQGVTTVMLNPAEMFKNGVGLPMSDLFLATYNPNKLRRRATVWSPDIGRAVRRITG